MAVYTTSGKVFRYGGEASWWFFPIPKNMSAEIKKAHHAHARGWGSIRVMVTIGTTTWHTSVFPDRKSGQYLLPLKAKVRTLEDIDDIRPVTVRITI
jgi:hypothetical protein